MKRHLGRNVGGNAAILFALALPVVLGGVAVAVDYSSLTEHKAELQRVADAGALAGAKAILANPDKPLGQIKKIAETTAEQVVWAKAPNAKVKVSVKGLNGDTENTVEAVVSHNKKLYFGGVVGHDHMNVGVVAKAVADKPETACIIALNADEPIGIDLQGSSDMIAPKCNVWSNSPSPTSINMQGSVKIEAKKTCTAGRVTGGGGNIRPAAQIGCPALKDPFVGRDLTQTKPCDVTSPVVIDSVSNPPLPHKVYCAGLTLLGNTSVDLAPGLYEFRGSPLRLQGSSRISGTGVSLLFTGANAILDIQGNGSITISAMTSGPLAGIAIAANTPKIPMLTSNLQGSAQLKLTGSMYFPHQRLSVVGSNRLELLGDADKLVVGSFANKPITGSSAILVHGDETRDPAAAGSIRISR